MNRCMIIIPYFGKFNSYFHLFLNSCRHNPDFDWLIFTNDRRYFDYPENVTVKYTDFDKMRSYIQQHFNFKISLKKPYKLCDYKIAYGDIFREYITGYEFWGFCDTDLIFGHLKQFITDEVLDTYDKILFRGHLVLMRNNSACRKLYKTRMRGMPADYRFVYKTNYCCHFDENEMWHVITKKRGIREWNQVVYADIDCNSFSFHAVQGTCGKAKQIYLYHNGAVYRFYMVGGGNVKKDEWAYIHLQKRHMKAENIKNINHYMIVPNCFINGTNAMNAEFIVQNAPEGVLYIRRRIERMKEIVINVKNGAIRYRIHRRMNGGI